MNDQSHPNGKKSRTSHRPTSCVLAAYLLVGLSLTGIARADSIFDEDWVPPKRAAPASPPAPAPTVVPAPPPTAVPTPPTPPAASPPTAAPTPKVPLPPALPVPSAPLPVARRPIPLKTDQTRLRKLMREVFAKELADRSMPARKKLSQTLISEAVKAAAQPVDQYVLLGGAYEAATEAQSPKLCFDAADAMAAAFDVDGRAMKLAALTALGRGGDADDAKAMVTEGLAIIAAAADDNDFDAVRKVSAAVELAAVRARDPALLASAREQVGAARALADQYPRVQADFATLATSPNDPAANLAVGRFLCLTKGDWEKGLAHLARGGDAALKVLAAKDLTASESAGTSPESADALLAIADAWWALAERESVPGPKSAIRSHAKELYDRATPGLAGLAKAKAEKRSAEVATTERTTGTAPGVAARRTRGPRVTAPSPAETTEAQKVIAEVVERYPDVLKEVKQLALAKIHDGTSLRRHGGGPQEIPGAFAPTPFAGAGGGILLWGVYEDWVPGNYLVVYRTQLLSEPKNKTICFLDVCKGGNTIASRRPTADEFKPNGWQSMPIRMKLDKQTTVEYRLWPDGHTIGLDRIYIFRLP